MNHRGHRGKTLEEFDGGQGIERKNKAASHEVVHRRDAEMQRKISGGRGEVKALRGRPRINEL